MLDQAVRPPAFPTQGQSVTAVKLGGKSRCTESVFLQFHSALYVILGQVFAGMRADLGGRGNGEGNDERNGHAEIQVEGMKPLGLVLFKRI